MPPRLFELVGTDAQRPFSPFCWRTRMALALAPAAETIPWCFTEKDAIAPHQSERWREKLLDAFDRMARQSPGYPV